jgi:phage gp16-like protein
MAVYSGLEDMDELAKAKKSQEEMEIDDIINMLDSKTQGGVSRIKVNVSEAQKEGTVKTQYHHGRCDVGSPWADGSVRNFGCD